MIKAVNKKGGETIFSDVDWKTGVPQRYGWSEKGEEALKTLPKEIVDFVKPKPKPIKDEQPIQTVEENKKKNDNTKQKIGQTGKRQPKGVGKAK